MYKIGCSFRSPCLFLFSILLFYSTLWGQDADSWSKAYGGSGKDRGYSVQQTPDGGFIIAGWTNSFSAGDADVYLIRTDAGGDTLWTRTYGGSYTDCGYSVQQTSDGGFIVAGNTYFPGEGRDVYLIRTDASGDTLWTRTYGGSGDNDGYSVQQTPDGGFIIAGQSHYDVYLIKTDANGDTLWTRTYGGTYIDEGRSVQQTSDGGFIVAGNTAFDVYLIKTDANGDTLWTATIHGDSTERAYSVQQAPDGGFIVAGWTNSFGAGDDDVYLIKVKEIILISPDGNEIWAGNKDYSILFRSLASSDFDHLRLVLSTDGGATYPYQIAENIPITDTVFQWTTPDINSSECRVKVQAISQTGEVLKEDESDANFIIDATGPEQVNLLKPDSSVYMNNTTVVFCWSKSTDNLSGVSYYEFQGAYDSLFTEGLFTTTTIDTYLTQILSDTTYYWRVRAVDSAGNQSNWSSVWRLEIDTTAPASPELLSPENNSWINTSSVVFDWSDVSRYFKSPVRYVIIIDTSFSFTNPVITDTTGFSCDTIGLVDRNYYWQVRAFDEAGNEGLWSSVWQFAIDCIAPVIDSTTVVNDTSNYFGPFDIMTKVTDAGMLFNPVLHYRIGASSSWEEDTMNALSNNWFKGAIPQITPQEITVEYYITVEDYAGNTSRDPLAGYYTFNITDINENKNIPSRCTLNVIPGTNGTLIITYGLPMKSDITISLFDCEGRTIKNIRAFSVEAGYHEIRLSQNTLNRGVYFARLSAKNHVLVKKFIIAH